MTEIDRRTPVRPIAQHARLHPLIACSAVALMLTCVVGVAAMTGAWSHAGAESTAALAGAPVAPPQPAPATPPPLSADAAPSGSAAIPPPQQFAQHTAPPVAAVSAPVCTTCGVVRGISSYRVSGKASGLGAVGGGVAGAGIGQFFGRGNGRIAATVGGAALGALGGHAAEKNIRSTTNFRVTVRMRTGTTRTFRYASTPPFSEGQSVRVKNGVLVAD